MISPERREEFAEWFIPLARKAGPEGRCRVSMMREAGGAVSDDGQAVSFAFQAEFETMAEIEAWVRGRLRPLVAAFERRFAPEAMVFTSVFETLG